MKGLQKHLPPSVKVYADLDNMRAEINPPATIPPNVLIISLRPDIVIIVGKEICLLELTVPTNFPYGLSQARSRKQNKSEYNILLNHKAGRFSTLCVIPLRSVL